jgi:hypothetical protein
VAESYSRRSWFQTDFVVDRISESLLAAQVSLRRLHAYMTEQELNLLKLPTSFMTQARAGPSQIVRSNIVDAAFRRTPFHNTPDHLRTETGLPDALGLVDGPKYRAGGDSGGSQPIIHCHFNPVRHRYGPNMPSLADQVGDYPVLFSLLQIFDGEASGLRPSESTSK